MYRQNRFLGDGLFHSFLVSCLGLISAIGPGCTSVRAAGIVSICNQTSLFAAVSGGGTVTFACSGTITLTQSIPISGNTTIDGSGQTVTISGNHAVQIFSEIAAGVRLHLIGLTVADGRAAEAGLGRRGGAIKSTGIVDIVRCRFTGNQADSGYTFGGAIFSTGTLIIQNSIFSNNSATSIGSYGGAIDNQGVAVITDSFFSNNIVNSVLSSGGAIDNTGTLTIARSTFQGNQAMGSTTTSIGGAITNSTSGTLNILNSTFSENTATGSGGAISNGTGSATITNSTFSGNSASNPGGTLRGTILLRNSIVVSSASAACTGAITDGGANIRWTGADGSCPGLNANPLLGPLQDNGGPTFTMALGTGSSAILRATANCPAGDQRSMIRPNLPSCDSGAYEFGSTQELHIRIYLPLSLR